SQQHKTPHLVLARLAHAAAQRGYPAGDAARDPPKKADPAPPWGAAQERAGRALVRAPGVHRQATGCAIENLRAPLKTRPVSARLPRPHATALVQAISRARITMMMAPMAATTICSTHSLPRLSFQPAALKTKPPTKAPMRPVIM